MMTLFQSQDRGRDADAKYIRSRQLQAGSQGVPWSQSPLRAQASDLPKHRHQLAACFRSHWIAGSGLLAGQEPGGVLAPEIRRTKVLSAPQPRPELPGFQCISQEVTGTSGSSVPGAGAAGHSKVHRESLGRLARQ